MQGESITRRLMQSPQCHLCSKKGHLGKVCASVDLQVKETNRVSHQNFTKDQSEYPSTMVTIKINGQ